MRATKTLCLIPAMAAIAFAQDPAPATSQSQHEERHTRSTETKSTSTMNSPREFSGKLVDASCSALSSRFSSPGTTTADRSASSSTAERRSTTTTDQNTSQEGAPATDRTETTRAEVATSSRTTSTADRSSEPMMSASDLESCAVKGSTSSYALAMPNGQVYKLSGTTLSDDISNHKKWSKRISDNDTKNFKVKVKGSLEGDTITVQSIK